MGESRFASRATRSDLAHRSSPVPDSTHEGPRPRLRSGPLALKSGDADVLGLRTLGASGDVELDLLVLVERLVTAGLDGGVVNENVLTPAVLRDETETLFGVAPL